MLLKKIIRRGSNYIKSKIGPKKNFQLQLKWNSVLHARALSKIRKKEKINVVFFLIHESVWKYDQLFKMLQHDPRFNPMVLVCPYIIYGEENMLTDLNKSYDFAKSKNYKTVKSLKDSGEWVDVKKELKPDLIFFTNPHELTKPEYYIHNFRDILTCYVPYSFQVSDLYEMQFNQDFHSLTWKNFYETEIHHRIATKYAKNKAKNVVITGYPGCDELTALHYKPKSNWVCTKAKKIIWAPHHTILESDDLLPYSNFLTYYETMICIAENPKADVQIAFKPHPILRAKLSLENVWGKIKTDQYYKRWDNAPNGLFEDGNYIDLFLTSDAIIHDSGSFVAEYLHVNKPSFFCVKTDKTLSHFNEFGKLALNNYYLVYNTADLLAAIYEKIIGGVDDMQEQRTNFINTYLHPKHGQTASLNIYNYLKLMIN